MSKTTIDVPKKKLSAATSLLFHIAARSHVLCNMFGIELENDEKIIIHQVPRRWLVSHPRDSQELSFDPDKFAAQWLGNCSTYSNHMVLWILNVWNPSYAKSKGWTFDLFAALRGLDDGNTKALTWWMERNIWP